MAIVWDAPLTTALAAELQRRLQNARLRAVFLDHGPRRAALHFREGILVFRLHPTRGEVTFHEAAADREKGDRDGETGGADREPPPGARSLHARVLGVRAPPDERLLLFRLEGLRGDYRGPAEIAVELMTNQWNLLVLVGTERRIRRVLWEREAGERLLRRGETYRPPEPSDRAGRDEPLSLEAWLEMLMPVPPPERRRTLLRGVAHTSSLNVPALLGEGVSGPGGEPASSARDEPAVRAGDEGSAEDDEEARLSAGHALWLRLREPPEPGAILLRTDRGLQPYPLPLPHLESEEVPTLLDAFQRALEAGEETPTPAAALLPSGHLDALRTEVHRAGGRVRQLRTELEGAPEPAGLRAVGDLILARFHEIPRGAGTVTLEDFHGEPVEVEMDPALETQENADRYYDRAGRAERARERLPALIEEAHARLEALEALLERAEEGEATRKEVEEALPAEALHRDEGGGAGAEDRLPYRAYRSSGGLEIRVGRGAKSNDELTFHHSRPDDVWLHARHAAGAHVILRWDGEGSPPRRDLAEAAVLAALHSKARHSGTVPVDWTRRKYVRSPRKSAPGVVIPERVKTVFVEPDPAVEARLREE